MNVVSVWDQFVAERGGSAEDAAAGPQGLPHHEAAADVRTDLIV